MQASTCLSKLVPDGRSCLQLFSLSDPLYSLRGSKHFLSAQLMVRAILSENGLKAEAFRQTLQQLHGPAWPQMHQKQKLG